MKKSRILQSALSVFLVIALLLPMTVGAASVTVKPSTTAPQSVTAVESPVASLDIEDVSIVEKTNGYDTGSYFRYSNGEPDFTVTMKDGSVYHSQDGGVWIDEEWYWLTIDSNQSEDNPWTAGHTYEATGTIMGVSDTYHITIVETPVASIAIEDVRIAEYTHGYDAGSHFEYDNYWPEFTVTLKDGTQLLSEDSFVWIDGERMGLTAHNVNQFENPWTVGNTYTATGTVAGASGTISVKIVKLPVKSIRQTNTWIHGIDDYETEGGFAFSTYALQFEVEMQDGEIVEGTDGSIYYKGEYYPVYSVDADGNTWDSFDFANADWHGSGTYTCLTSVCGCTQNVGYTIQQNPYQSLEIVNKDKNLQLVFHKKAGGTDVYNATWFKSMGGSPNAIVGVLITDKRVFRDVYFSYVYDEECVYPKNVELTVGKMISNTLSGSDWLNVIMFWSYFPGNVMSCHLTTKSTDTPFLGYRSGDAVTADTVDYIISLACIATDTYGESNANASGVPATDGDYSFVGVEAIQKAVKDTFGIENIDVTKSKYYDPANPQKLKVIMYWEDYAEAPIQSLTYENGHWVLICKENAKYSDAPIIATVTLTDNYMIDSIVFEKEDALSYGDFTYANTQGGVKITGYTGQGGMVAVPDKINGKTVTAIDDGTFANCAGVTIRSTIGSCAQSFAKKHAIPFIAVSPTIGWQDINGNWYYFGTGGVAVTGWAAIGGKWYYFNSDYAMVTGWQSIGGKWYTFNSSGVWVS